MTQDDTGKVGDWTNTCCEYGWLSRCCACFRASFWVVWIACLSSPVVAKAAAKGEKAAAVIPATFLMQTNPVLLAENLLNLGVEVAILPFWSAGGWMFYGEERFGYLTHRVEVYRLAGAGASGHFYPWGTGLAEGFSVRSTAFFSLRGDSLDLGVTVAPGYRMASGRLNMFLGAGVGHNTGFGSNKLILPFVDILFGLGL